MKRKIRVGSRESKLALVQTQWAINEIRRVHPELEFVVIGMKTEGDRQLDTRLDKIGGKGLFIKELERALLQGEIDLAVHSLKDMPAELAQGLTLAALSRREDPRDVLVTEKDLQLNELPEGAVVGTSSVRREMQLACRRPDLQFKTLRGNVLTRLNKLVNKEYDALVLAAAGLRRLGLEYRCTRTFSIEEMVPAVGQGILALETREEDDSSYLLDSIHCPDAALAASAERMYMIRLNGGCTTPMGAHAVIEEGHMKLYGMLAREGHTSIYKAVVEGNKHDAVTLGSMLADKILEQIV
jgi:hydroxymethylbilane synthase